MIKKIVKKTLWYLQGGYRPQRFWDKWAKTFMDDQWQVQTHPQHHWMLEKIRGVKPKNILEVGCGFGRNIKFLIENRIDPAIITGVDISPEMLIRAKQYLKDWNISLSVSQAKKLPFNDKSFDLILVHGVLMHIKPEDIIPTVQELHRVAKRYILVVEQNYGGNEYTFIHNYQELFLKEKLTLAEHIHNVDLGLDYFLLEV